MLYFKVAFQRIVSLKSKIQEAGSVSRNLLAPTFRQNGSNCNNWPKLSISIWPHIFFGLIEKTKKSQQSNLEFQWVSASENTVQIVLSLKFVVIWVWDLFLNKLKRSDDKQFNQVLYFRTLFQIIRVKLYWFCKSF
jgi:hypothetical protein